MSLSVEHDIDRLLTGVDYTETRPMRRVCSLDLIKKEMVAYTRVARRQNSCHAHVLQMI